MYWLIECNPETGLETNRFKYKFLAQKEMKRRHREHSTAERVSSYICEFEAMVNTDIGTYEWKIVGQPDPEREEIVRQILESSLLTEDDIGEPVFEFWADHWNEFDASGPDIDRHAWLNTLFGYDIGFDNAMKIEDWLWGGEIRPRQYRNMEALDMTINDKSLIQQCAKELDLNLSFDKWATKEPDVYRYDFN